MYENYSKKTASWACDCGREVEVYSGGAGRDIQCECGQWWNAFGQRLRHDWQDRSTYAEWGEEW